MVTGGILKFHDIFTYCCFIDLLTIIVYARMSTPTAGIARINAVAIHHVVWISPRILPLRAMIAAPKPARTLTSAIKKASSPRVRQPNTSTGVAATAKKRIGMIDGKRMWRKVGDMMFD